MGQRKKENMTTVRIRCPRSVREDWNIMVAEMGRGLSITQGEVLRRVINVYKADPFAFTGKFI